MLVNKFICSWVNMNKTISYLGFAKKSGGLITGQTSLKICKKKLYLIMVCCSASDNLKNLAKNLGVKHNCPVIETAVKLDTLITEKDIKILGLTNQELSKAIVTRQEIQK